jgi:hypothetical protein
MTATIHTFPSAIGLGAPALVAHYLASVYPSRGHGATDCGAYLDGTAGLSDGDHFLMWLAAEGFVVVRMEDVT